jgi:hypothetical protein
MSAVRVGDHLPERGAVVRVGDGDEVLSADAGLVAADGPFEPVAGPRCEDAGLLLDGAEPRLASFGDVPRLIEPERRFAAAGAVVLTFGPLDPPRVGGGVLEDHPLPRTELADAVADVLFGLAKACEFGSLRVAVLRLVCFALHFDHFALGVERQALELFDRAVLVEVGRSVKHRVHLS